MVLVRIAYAADLPTPDEAIRSLGERRAADAASPRPPRQWRRHGDVASARRRRRRHRCAAMRSAARRAARRRLLAALSAGTASGRSRAGRAALAIGSFEELVALAAEKRDLQIKTALERDVRLVRCEDGKLEIALEPGAAKTLVNELSAQAHGLDRPAMDGGALARARPADPEGAGGRARGRTRSAACAAIRWCRRCWNAFPAPRSSRCAPRETEQPTRRRRDDDRRCRRRRQRQRKVRHGRFHGDDEEGGRAAIQDAGDAGRARSDRGRGRRPAAAWSR